MIFDKNIKDHLVESHPDDKSIHGDPDDIYKKVVESFEGGRQDKK